MSITPFPQPSWIHPVWGGAVGVLWIMSPSIGTTPVLPHTFWCFPPLGMGTHDEHDAQVAPQMNVVEDLMVEHHVVVFALYPFKA